MNALEEIVGALRRVIQLEEDTRGSYSGMATTVYDVASKRYPPMAQVHLDSILRAPQRIDWTRDGPHLFLPRTTKGKVMIPVSGMVLDLSDQTRPEVRFHVAFFAANDLVPEPADAAELHGMGYRFETPEGGGVGMHGYYHAQPFTHFVKNDDETHLANCPKWLPVQQPAFPLNAGDPLGLLAILLVSIYGPNRVQADFGPELVARIPKAETRELADARSEHETMADTQKLGRQRAKRPSKRQTRRGRRSN